MIRFTEIVYFMAGEDMKASEWVHIVGDGDTVFRAVPDHPDVDGAVAYINGIVDYVKGDIVPVYIFVKTEYEERIKKTCPKCDGVGYIYEEI